MKKSVYAVVLASSVLLANVGTPVLAETTKNDPQAEQKAPALTLDELKATNWTFSFEKNDEPLKHFIAAFDETHMTLTVDAEKSQADPNQTWENKADKTLVKDIQIKVEYKINGDKMHLKNEVLKLDDDYTIKKDGDTLTLTPPSDKKDLEPIVLKQQAKTLPVTGPEVATPAVYVPATVSSFGETTTWQDSYTPWSDGTTPATPAAPAAPEAEQQATPVLTFSQRLEAIYNDYANRIRTAGPVLLNEYRQAAAEKMGDNDALFEILEQKGNDLDAIFTEGLGKMADVLFEDQYDADFDTNWGIYLDWGQKLGDVYLEEVNKISDAYVEDTMPKEEQTTNSTETPATTQEETRSNASVEADTTTASETPASTLTEETTAVSTETPAATTETQTSTPAETPVVSETAAE